MLIAFYWLVRTYLMPELADVFAVSFHGIMLIVLTIAAIVLMFGAVGMKISSNLGSTVTNNLFKGIGFIGKQIFKGIGWFFSKCIPGMFRGTRRVLIRAGMKDILANVLAIILTFVLLVVII